MNMKYKNIYLGLILLAAAILVNNVYSNTTINKYIVNIQNNTTNTSLQVCFPFKLSSEESRKLGDSIQTEVIDFEIAPGTTFTHEYKNLILLKGPISLYANGYGDWSWDWLFPNLFSDEAGIVINQDSQEETMEHDAKEYQDLTLKKNWQSSFETILKYKINYNPNNNEGSISITVEGL